jgi:hypothetical protein
LKFKSSSNSLSLSLSFALHFTAWSDPNDLSVFQTSRHHKGHLETRKNIAVNFNDGF